MFKTEFYFLANVIYGDLMRLLTLNPILNNFGGQGCSTLSVRKSFLPVTFPRISHTVSTAIYRVCSSLLSLILCTLCLPLNTIAFAHFCDLCTHSAKELFNLTTNTIHRQPWIPVKLKHFTILALRERFSLSVLLKA
ncbi:hypothetical protein BH78_28895 [Pseudomonas aeruginosa C1913C]|nr:hypothetical protein BH78_28895 [Pseudomonas aeruginosa C1913C]